MTVSFETHEIWRYTVYGEALSTHRYDGSRCHTPPRVLGQEASPRGVSQGLLSTTSLSIVSLRSLC